MTGQLLPPPPNFPGLLPLGQYSLGQFPPQRIPPKHLLPTQIYSPEKLESFWGKLCEVGIARAGDLCGGEVPGGRGGGNCLVGSYLGTLLLIH